MANNTKLYVSDVFLDTVNKTTYVVTRVLGNRMLEVAEVTNLSVKKLLETDVISRGLVSGVIRRVTSSES